MEESEDCKTEYYYEKGGFPENGLIEAILEFLLKNGYFRSVDTFQEELNGQGSNIDEFLRKAESNFRFGQAVLLEVYPKKYCLIGI